jgi:hypothetical protein
MLPILRRGVVFCLALAALSALAAAPPPPASAPAPTDLQKTFPDLRRRLASSDFAQRDAAQKLLDAVPPSQLEILRTLAKDETDPEVQARLDGRVKALEIYLLTHPPALSLHVKDATFPQVCSELSRQLGGAASIVPSTTVTGRFTLQADNVPFWEIIRQLQSQNPFAVSAATAISTTARTSVRFIRVSDATMPRYRVVDSFLVHPQITGNPSTGAWTFSLSFIADPRVRIAQYSSELHVAKATDQDGASLIPALVASSFPPSSPLIQAASSWASAVTFNAAPGLKSIKELRAAVDLAILENERTVTVDLAKPTAPIETSRGTLTVENAAGTLIVRFVTPKPDLDPAAVPVARRVPTTIRLLDQNGQIFATTFTTGTLINLGPGGARPPAKVQITWPDSIRTLSLPVELHDLPLPNPRALPRREPL